MLTDKLENEVFKLNIELGKATDVLKDIRKGIEISNSLLFMLTRNEEAAQVKCPKCQSLDINGLGYCNNCHIDVYAALKDSEE